MERKPLTDIIDDARGKLAVGSESFVNVARAKRESIRRTLDETYCLIDTTLNMVIIWLGDIQLLLPTTTSCARAPGRTTTATGRRRIESSGFAIGREHAHD